MNPILLDIEVEIETAADAPPDTVLVSAPLAISNDITPSITYTGTDDNTLPAALTYEYRSQVNGGGFGAWLAAPSGSVNNTLNLGPLADGDWDVEIRAIDSLLQVDPTPLAVAFIIDTVAPNTTINSGPSGTTNDATPTYTFSGTDDVSLPGALTFERQIDVGGWVSVTTPDTLPVQADGPHTVEYRATDEAGNPDPSPASVNITVDTVAPGLVTGFTATRLTATNIQLDWLETGDNAGVGTAASREFRYRTDGAAVTDVSWATSTPVVPATDIQGGALPSMSVAGTSKTAVFTAADAVSDWSFGCRVTDAATNEGLTASSNVVSPDVVNPGSVTGFAVRNQTTTTVEGSWYETGDDGGGGGPATAREIRYRTDGVPFTTANFGTGTPVGGIQPAMAAPGTKVSMTFTGLPEGTILYFGIRVRDEASNFGLVTSSDFIQTLSLTAGGSGASRTGYRATGKYGGSR